MSTIFCVLRRLGTAANLEAHSLGDITQSDGTLNERAVIFALLRFKQPDFIWDCRNDFVEWHRGLGCNVLLNRYQRSFVYTSKVLTLWIGFTNTIQLIDHLSTMTGCYWSFSANEQCD